MTKAEEHARYATERCKELVDEATKIRNENFFSQREISEIMGLSSHGNLGLIETHKTVPRLDWFLRLLSALGYTLTITKK